jgi:ferredoxin
MPKLTVNEQTIEVPGGRKLVLAIEDAGVKIGHRCGGFARCTTCRVEFAAGEPETMTTAEREKLSSGDNLGKFRLSCQIVCDHDMAVAALMTAETMPQWNGDTGPKPEEQVLP